MPLKKFLQMKAAISVLCALFLASGCTATQEQGVGRNVDVTVTCPVSGTMVKAEDSAQMVEHQGEKYFFCCSSCRKEFEKNPEKYLAR